MFGSQGFEERVFHHPVYVRQVSNVVGKQVVLHDPAIFLLVARHDRVVRFGQQIGAMRRFPGAQETAPPAEVLRAIGEMAALLGGERRDLSVIALDMDGIAPFARSVYEVARAIPAGSVMTYGEITTKLGAEPQVARDVGKALGENPIPLIIPCHRVLAANGKPGGYSGSGGVKTKLQLLTIEGAKLSEEPSLFEKLPLTARPGR